MKNFIVAVHIFFLFSDSKEWPSHTVCRESDLKVYYRSCDPLQDIGFSMEPCTKVLPDVLHIKLALLLKFIYFEGPIKSGISTVPKEEYDLSLELINEDMYNIACVNITLIGH
ncbi:lymphocyte antigen 86 isoform X5 [Rhinatrema bivittatum]|uniref:lymphocyte antigen 86 isoform X5 n=1 Tax=Rhinatrema bivittatum TaxID=194408 RepID=UPI0011262945|nr:lymphocyte antigen 86 isoform X5 [Rhinatrema bivittatum]